MPPKNKRRKAVIDSRVQWTLAGRVVMHFLVFICGGLFVGLIFQFLSNPMGSLSDHLGNFWRQSAPMIVAMVCLIPVFVRDTLTLSNRIAGPVCRLRDTVRRIANGEDVPPVKFRQHDMWQDLPGYFNSMVDRLKQSDPAVVTNDRHSADDAAVVPESERTPEFAEA